MSHQEVEKIRERLRRVSLMGGPFDAQQMFNDARDLLVVVDDLSAELREKCYRGEDSYVDELLGRTSPASGGTDHG